MELLRLELSGRPGRVTTPPGSPPHEQGLMGVDVAAKSFDGHDQVVVQALFDDDVPGFDRSWLDCPLVAELVGPDGRTIARDLFDHDRFRQDLRAERDAGIDDLRGVLVLHDGELPPRYLRLAFLALPIDATAGTTLVIGRTAVETLVGAVDRAHADGEITDAQRRSMLVTIEQRHPPGGP